MTREDRPNLDKNGRDSNPDPITGEPGSSGGNRCGCRRRGRGGRCRGGLVGGPVAPPSALRSVPWPAASPQGVAESIDPTVEDAYWRENYARRPYYDQRSSYDVFRPAYKYGWESRSRYANRSFDEVEPELRRKWESAKDGSKLAWDKASLPRTMRGIGSSILARESIPPR